MGRRSVNTTKSGKFMNPTDQARKEARKKELKKNKKQRKMVREHVLKGKDPNQILEEIEKLDEIEIQNGPVPMPNDKAIKEKKRKLRETLDRLLSVYEKEDPARVIEIKRVLSESEKRRANLMVHAYEEKHNASEVGGYAVADIPMPDTIPLPRVDMVAPGSIPLPGAIPPYAGFPMMPPGPPMTLPPGLVPPGPPPGPPPKEAFRFNTVGYNKTEEPMLSNMQETAEDDDGESTGESEGMDTDEEHLAPPGEEENEEIIPHEKKNVRHVRFDEAADDSSDQNDSEDAPKSLQERLLKLAGQPKKAEQTTEESHEENNPSTLQPGMVPPGPPPGLPRQPRPAHMMNFQRPMMRMLPPGPPPGRPPGLPAGMPPRMPPRPPPGLPPNIRGPRPLGPLPPRHPPPGLMSLARHRPPLPPGAVLSAPPSVFKPAVLSLGSGDTKQDQAVFSAKPQLRNTQAEVTRLVPVALRVKREQPRTNKQKVKSAIAEEGFRPSPVNTGQVIQGPTKDDAYAQFMKEMEVLL